MLGLCESLIHFVRGPPQCDHNLGMGKEKLLIPERGYRGFYTPKALDSRLIRMRKYQACEVIPIRRRHL